jgi:CRP/FNR family cyclic AMP-dependent transcriptional regulator
VKSDAHKALVASLFDNAEPLTFPKNQIILHASDTLEHVYRIVEGFIKVYSINSRGDEQVHVVYGPGDIFPLTIIIHDNNSSFFYQTLTETLVMRVAFSEVDELLQTNAPLAYATLQRAVAQYKVYVARVYSLEYRFARERLAHRLLVLAGRFGTRVEEGIELQAPLTQQVIASSINLSRETVSREMERMVAKGYIKEISRSGKPIVILNPAGLAAEIPGTPIFALENPVL